MFQLVRQITPFVQHLGVGKLPHFTNTTNMHYQPPNQKVVYKSRLVPLFDEYHQVQDLEKIK